jgi:hypothetical protein
MTAADVPPGRPEGGMKSEGGRATYWRMQWESAVGALADLIAEHTETVDALRALEALPPRLRDLADWHDTKADKARRFPGPLQRNEDVMKGKAEVHDEAARRLRELADRPPAEEESSDDRG